jgi:superfamily II DNA or RNA helicase
MTFTDTPAAPATTVVLTIGRHVVIEPGYPAELRRVVRDRFTLPNPAYQEALRFDRDTRDLPERLLYYDVRPDGALVVPRGALELVYRDVRALGLAPRWTDETHVAAPVAFDEMVTLSPAQERAVDAALGRRMGLVCAPAGSGKTCMGLVAVARRQQPALWLTHTVELARQAVARATTVLGLAPDEIGFIGDGECRVGERLTIALVQTLARGIPPALLDVGHLVVDEAHHIAAEQMADVVSQFPARYVTGLTATPFRRDKLDQVIFWHLGPIVATIDKEDLADRLLSPHIIKRDTGLRVAGDSFTELVSALVGDVERNRLIVADVVTAVVAGRRCLVLSERVGHVEQLTAMLQAAGVVAAALHGQLPKRERTAVVDAMNAGDLAVAVATGSLVGEGFDVPRTDWLALATPLSFGGRVTQYIGRVSRTAPGKVDAIVVDYCDDHRMLWATWRNRRIVYERQGCPIATSPASPALAIRPRRSA